MPKEETNVARAVNVAKTTMKGDLRDVLLDIMRDPKLTGKAWKDMKEDEQREVVERVNRRIEHAITTAIDIISSEGRRHVKVLLKQVTIKDNLKGVFECAKSEELRHELIDAQGSTVLVVAASADPYLGERRGVKIDKDQGDLVEKAAQTTPEKEQPNGTTEKVNPETGEVTTHPADEAEDGQQVLEKASAEIDDEQDPDADDGEEGDPVDDEDLDDEADEGKDTDDENL